MRFDGICSARGWLKAGDFKLKSVRFFLAVLMLRPFSVDVIKKVLSGMMQINGDRF